MAETLRAHCRFELALRWYQRVFEPLNGDNTWMRCDRDRSESAPTTDGNNGSVLPLGACCDSADVTDAVARQRSLTLHYCETLLEWGDALMRRRRSPEAFQQAQLLYNTVARVLGRRPQSLRLPEPAKPPSVTSFQPAFAPLNPRLLDLYDRDADRRELLHACLNARRLHNGRPRRDMPYFGDNPLREGWRTAAAACADEEEWCHRPSPYRWMFLIQKALEFAGKVSQLGGALLAALEKGDAEYLAAVRAGHERELLALGLSVRQNQWRDADWQVQALQQTKNLHQANLFYYNNLYQNGLINDEIQNENLATSAMETRTVANTLEAAGQVMELIPDVFVGAMSSGSVLPVGTKLAKFFGIIAKVTQTIADIQSATAALDLTTAGWTRRSVEWNHQTQTLPIEIQQVELQILGAQRRRDQALQELNNQLRQVEQATEIQDFLRDKFTATDLYLWMQRETVALYTQMYELARACARQAERAFNFERGHTTRRFLPEEAWDNLRGGLLAGERLEVALRHMEKAYYDENVREYELTRHFSLRVHFPLAYLQLRAMGHCEVELPEWMFDLDHPGMFMRRIRNLTLTIPCVAGPYNAVNCRLTLLSSWTRVDPRLSERPAGCCCDGWPGNGYETFPGDPRIVKEYAAREAIATSSGQNDAGLFELNFRDERYLPFEFLGAVCRLRIELPPENNFFDMDSLSDVILNLNYTAREGGEVLRRAANEIAQRHLPGAGVRFFDVRHEFPDGWQLFQGRPGERDGPGELGLRLGRGMFPFLPGHRPVTITGFDVFFEAPCAEAGGHRDVEFLIGPRVGHSGEGRSACAVRRVSCSASAEWPGLYHGVLDLRVGPLSRHPQDIGTLRFPHGCHAINHVYLLCRWVSDRPEGECHEDNMPAARR